MTSRTSPLCHELISSVRRSSRALILGAALFHAVGCSHKQEAVYTPPAPEPPAETTPAPAPPALAPVPSLTADEQFVDTHQPISSETGMASWYGPPYHNRVGANGTVYNENGISAAHRTLPMGSLIRVTNVKTGTGAVRIDVFSTPKPMDAGGRWCVQIGAFLHQGSALQLQSELQRQYRNANVIEFAGPTGYWVRIRPANDDRTIAVAIAQNLQPAEGEAWLVRLD
jgi:rare lipoprotein A